MKVSAQAPQAVGDVLRWALVNPGTIQCVSNELPGLKWYNWQVVKQQPPPLCSKAQDLWCFVPWAEHWRKKRNSDFWSSFPCSLSSLYISVIHQYNVLLVTLPRKTLLKLLNDEIRPQILFYWVRGTCQSCWLGYNSTVFYTTEILLCHVPA